MYCPPILQKQVEGKTYYWVKWLDYPENQNTWEPIENLKNVRKLIDNYMERRKHLGKEPKVEEDAHPDKPAVSQDDSERNKKRGKKSQATQPKRRLAKDKT